MPRANYAENYLHTEFGPLTFTVMKFGATARGRAAKYVPGCGDNVNDKPIRPRLGSAPSGREVLENKTRGGIRRVQVWTSVITLSSREDLRLNQIKAPRRRFWIPRKFISPTPPLHWSSFLWCGSWPRRNCFRMRLVRELSFSFSMSFASLCKYMNVVTTRL